MLDFSLMPWHQLHWSEMSLNGLLWPNVTFVKSRKSLKSKCWKWNISVALSGTLLIWSGFKTFFQFSFVWFLYSLTEYFHCLNPKTDCNNMFIHCSWIPSLQIHHNFRQTRCPYGWPECFPRIWAACRMATYCKCPTGSGPEIVPEINNIISSTTSCWPSSYSLLGWSCSNTFHSILLWIRYFLLFYSA